MVWNRAARNISALKRKIKRFSSRISFYLLLPLCLLISTGLTQTNYFERLNWILYDSLHPYMGQQPTDEVVVVAIDEKSLKALGRWPWSRSIHQKMLTRLESFKPQAIGLDMLLSEPEGPVDAQLAETVRRLGNVVLAVAPEKNTSGIIDSESIPVVDLATSAAGLGHVDYELSIDGICRAVYLYAGLGKPTWPAFPLAMLKAANVDFSKSVSVESGSSIYWQRDQFFLVPYLSKEQTIKHLSYVDVLEGRADEALKGKFILIGATAVGLGDQLSTPVSGEHQRMAGVAVNAHTLDALLQKREITMGSLSSRLVMVAVVLLLVFWAGYKLRYSRLTLCLPLLLLGVVGSSFLLLRFQSLWVPPIEALVSVLLAYFFFGLRKQSLAQGEIMALSESLTFREERDPISELPNRRSLESSLERYLVDARKAGELVAVFVVNIGQVRHVNDRLGFKVGDKLLQMTAERILSVIGDGAKLAKINAEYAVVQKVSTEIRVSHVGGRILQILQQPVEWDGNQFDLPPSVGVSIFPVDGYNSEILINNAFTAMHRAKADKYRGLLFYSEQLKRDVEQRSVLDSDLRLAISRGELEVYLQPQVCAETHRILGAEALLRWHHPERGDIPPDRFIPLAEESGAILDIGAWVLRQSCGIIAHWISLGIEPVRLAVNVSAVQLREDSFIDLVRSALGESCIPPDLLELEVTETALMKDMDKTVQLLEKIRGLGVKVAVDDFGTGYSSLNYLNMFPIDCLKIDRAFVQEIGVRQSGEEIILSIISMAHNLGLSIVAEGVETDEQAEFLSEHSDLLQGYYFARPMPADQFLSQLADQGL